MDKPEKLSKDAIERFIAAHAGCWTTHDTGGISTLDAEMASQVDLVYRR